MFKSRMSLESMQVKHFHFSFSVAYKKKKKTKRFQPKFAIKICNHWIEAGGVSNATLAGYCTR